MDEPPVPEAVQIHGHAPDAGAAASAVDRRANVVDPVFAVTDLSVFYGSFEAVRGVSMDIGRNQITALIGPSGCGKSTVLRCFNRMNDLIPGAHIAGKILYHDQDLYGDRSMPIEVRRRIGMVFQKPNPFPKSIYDNIAYGPKVTRHEACRRPLDDVVEEALTGCGAVGRGQGQAQAERPVPVRWPAAAAVHRPRDRGQARGHPHGRALLGPRPDRDREDRGPHAGSGARLHDRDRHAQHAAGRSRLRPHRILHRRGRREGRAARPARRVRHDEEDLLQPAATGAPRTTSPAASARASGARFSCAVGRSRRRRRPGRTMPRGQV